MALERVLHCDGIWLHCLRMSGQDWKFESKLFSDLTVVIVL